MKASFFKPLLQTAVVIGVLAAAYLLGRSQRGASPPQGTKIAAGQANNRVLTGEQAWEQLKSNGRPNDQDENIHRILDNVNFADIPALLEKITTLPQDFPDKEYLIHSLLMRSMLNDPLAALSLVNQYADSSNRDQLLQSAYHFLMAKDPQRGLSELAKLPLGTRTDGLYRSTFATWAGSHSDGPPDDAMAAALALPVGPERDAALRGVAEGWVSRAEDAQDVLKWASSLPPADAGILEAAMLQVAQSQPQVAAQNLDKLTSASVRNQAIGVIAKSMSQNDPAAALDFLDQAATGTVYDNSVKALFGQLAQNDPATGAALLGKLTDQADRNAAISQLAKNWSGTDPKDAMTWAMALPTTDGAARAGALNAIIANWANYDPQAALAFAQNSPDATLLFDAAPSLAVALAKTDPQKALDWANQLPEGTGKTQAINNVLVAVAQSNPTTAWDYAAALPVGNARDGAMSSVIGVVAQKNASQAVVLLSQFSSDAATQAATATVVAAWTKQDSTAAIAWVAALPAGAQRDAALVPLAASQIAKHPSTALDMANSIGNNQTRLEQVKSVIRQWAKSNPEAAANAAQAVDMPAGQRAALLSNIAKAGAASGK